jgi:uracil-DNA glycosylase family protein
MLQQCLLERCTILVRCRPMTSPTLTTAAAILAEVQAVAGGCTRCPLHRLGTQTVFGEGPVPAPVMIVGEQPGDREDTQGRPFVGPAGNVLDAALRDAGVERRLVYVTNAVKHFKNEVRGKRRIHQKPNAGEIDVCKWWLQQELSLVAPRIIVALGATAARALLGRPVPVQTVRGEPIKLGERTLLVTIHPSFLLRIPDAAARAAQRERFVEDLGQISALLSASSRRPVSGGDHAGGGTGLHGAR